MLPSYAGTIPGGPRLARTPQGAVAPASQPHSQARSQGRYPPSAGRAHPTPRTISLQVASSNRFSLKDLKCLYRPVASQCVLALDVQVLEIVVEFAWLLGCSIATWLSEGGTHVILKQRLSPWYIVNGSWRLQRKVKLMQTPMNNSCLPLCGAVPPFQILRCCISVTNLSQSRSQPPAAMGHDLTEAAGVEPKMSSCE